MNVHCDYQKINDDLYSALSSDPHYRDQLKAVFEAEFCDVGPSFLGFNFYYYHLAQIIPRDRVIYDLGCAEAFQSWFFRDHAKYIGVDLLAREHIKPPNAEFHHGSISEFLKTHKIEDPHFAICNYVPPWHGDNQKLVRDAFRHCFVFYPEHAKSDPDFLLFPSSQKQTKEVAFGAES